MAEHSSFEGKKWLCAVLIPFGGLAVGALCGIPKRHGHNWTSTVSVFVELLSGGMITYGVMQEWSRQGSRFDRDTLVCVGLTLGFVVFDPLIGFHTMIYCVLLSIVLLASGSMVTGRLLEKGKMLAGMGSVLFWLVVSWFTWSNIVTSWEVGLWMSFPHLLEHLQ